MSDVPIVEKPSSELAQQLFDASQYLESPRLQAFAERMGQEFLDREPEELRELARTAHYGLVPTWVCYMPITWRQRCLLGRIYSFQRSKDERDDGQLGFRMSLKTIAKELNYDRGDVIDDLNKLVEKEYLVKFSNGERRPKTYVVDEVRCMRVAIENGYKPL